MPETTIAGYVQTQLTKNQSQSMDALALISRKLVERINSERRDVAVDFNRPDYVKAQTDKAHLLSFKASIADNLSVLGKASNAIGWIDSTLNSTVVDLQAALQSSDPQVRADAAAEFDDALKLINSKVDGAGQTIDYRNVNLVGGQNLDFSVSKLYVKTDDHGGGTLVEGSYLGTHYNIDGGDGTVWRLDEGSNSYVQYQDDGTSTPTGQKISADDMTVDSYDSDTGAVSLTASDGTTLSGTVVKGGLGLLSSGFYNGFQDDASLQRAIDDINTAIATETSRGASLKATNALVQSSSDMAQKKVVALDRELSAITQQEVDETSAQNRAAQLKASLAVNNINLVAQHNTALVQNLLDMTQGNGPAIGVFGALGY